MIAALPYIFSIGAAQAFLLAIVLWKKKVNITSNKLLAVWLLFLCIDLAIKTISLSNEMGYASFFYRLIQFFPFLYGSFFYIYVRTLTNNQKLKLKDLIHFSAFIVFFSINIPALIGLSGYKPIGISYFDSVLYTSSISYVSAGIYLVYKYRKNLSSQQVDIKDVDLYWLMIMGFSQIIIWLIAVSQWLIPIPSYNHWTIYIAVSIWIIITGYLSHFQQNIPPITSIITPNSKKLSLIHI